MYGVGYNGPDQLHVAGGGNGNRGYEFVNDRSPQNYFFKALGPY